MLLRIIKISLLSLFLSITIVFVVEHFGEFSYLEVSDSSYSNSNNGKISFHRKIPLKAKVSTIHLKTPFGSYLTFNGNKFTVYEMLYGSFNKYHNKADYYQEATIKDFKFIIYFGVAIFSLLFLVFNFRWLRAIIKQKMKPSKISVTAIFTILVLVVFVSVGAYKYYELIKKVDSLEYENDKLNDKISDLEYENDEIKSELINYEKDYDFYKSYYSENNMVVYPMVEYGLLQKNNLTKFIDYDDPREKYVYGEKRVRCKIDNFKDYFELERAVQTDLFLKYTYLLNLAYDGDGLKYYYKFNPY